MRFKAKFKCVHALCQFRRDKGQRNHQHVPTETGYIGLPECDPPTRIGRMRVVHGGRCPDTGRRGKRFQDAEGPTHWTVSGRGDVCAAARDFDSGQFVPSDCVPSAALMQTSYCRSPIRIRLIYLHTIMFGWHDTPTTFRSVGQYLATTTMFDSGQFV